MKKVFATMGATILLGAMCAGFSACGDDADNFTSQEVDKETFAEAFAEANFVNVVFEGTLVTEAGEGNEYGKSTMQIKFVVDGTKEYMTATVKYEGAAAVAMEKAEMRMEAYYSAGDAQSDTTVYYRENAGTWKTTTTGMSYGYSMYQPTEVLGDYLFDEDEYGLFAFDKEMKGYYYEEANGENVLLKFKDGKLYSVRAVEKISGGTQEISFVFSYGGQNLTLPDV